MSIDDEIARLSGNGLESLQSRQPRSLYVGHEVREMIEPPYVGSEGELFVQARGMLENFAANNWISLRWNPDNRRPATLARTKPLNRYVFDFRTQDPDQGGLRIFGRFAKKDCFVALTYQFRDLLNGDEWEKEVERCRNAWIDLFGDVPCLEKDEPNDYLSANFSIARPKGR